MWNCYWLLYGRYDKIRKEDRDYLFKDFMRDLKKDAWDDFRVTKGIPKFISNVNDRHCWRTVKVLVIYQDWHQQVVRNLIILRNWCKLTRDTKEWTLFLKKEIELLLNSLKSWEKTMRVKIKNNFQLLMFFRITSTKGIRKQLF